jgi:hypothetical protein
MLTNGVIHYSKIPDLSNREHSIRSDASPQKTRSPGKLLLLACSFSTALSPLAFAGTPASPQDPSVMRGAEVIETVFPSEFNRDLRSLPQMITPFSGQVIEINPRQQHGGPAVVPPTAFAQLDPLLQLLDRGSFQTQNASRVPGSFDKPKLNFEGQSFSGFAPPDTIGDVGRKHYIQMINGPTGSASFVIYNKSGLVLVPQTALQNLATNGPCTSGLGDPIVLYDPLADRWLMSELADSFTDLCVYISKTNDPRLSHKNFTCLSIDSKSEIESANCSIVA